MFNTTAESNSDEDLGSGGAMVLPTLNDAMGTPHPLAVGAGKDGNAYVVDRGNMGKFNSGNNSAVYQILQLCGSGGGCVFSSPAWFNGTLYYGPVGEQLRAYPYTGGAFSLSPASSSSIAFGYPGTTPSISANGASDGIVWAMENASPAVLHAYDATNLAHELYNSNQAGSRDNFGVGNKYMVPTIANGKVYAAATSSDNSTNVVGVFGLLGGTLAADSVMPNSGSGASQTFTVQYSDTAGAERLQSVYLLFGSSLTEVNSCTVFYDVPSKQIHLLRDNGATSASAKPGAAKTLQNSQCSVGMAGSSAILNGNMLTLNLAMTFAPSYAGLKSVFGYTADQSGLNGGWQQLGTWTVPAGVPTVLSVNPSSGAGTTRTFTVRYSDTATAASLQQVYAIFSSALTEVNSCTVIYDVPSKQIILLGDDPATVQSAEPGARETFQNSQCSLNVATSSVAVNRDTLAIRIAIRFSAGYAGEKNIFGYAADRSGSISGWQQLGIWNVP
jgi:hypothetical protein